MSLHFGRYKDGTTLNLSQFPNTLLDENNHSRINRIGRFGVGILAAFLLGNEITVTTKSIKDNIGYNFKTSLDEGQIEIHKVDNVEIGTKIEIVLTEEIVFKLFTKTEIEPVKFLYDELEQFFQYHIDWDKWYKLDHPKVFFKTFENDEWYFQDNSIFTNKSLWNSLETNEFGTIYWTYISDVYRKVLGLSDFDPFHFSRSGGRVICNGFILPDTYKLSIRKEGGIVPSILISDSDNHLDISLDRRKINSLLPFDNLLIKDLNKSFISKLLTLKLKNPFSTNKFYLKTPEYIKHTFLGEIRLFYTVDGFFIDLPYFTNKASNSDLVDIEISLDKKSYRLNKKIHIELANSTDSNKYVFSFSKTSNEDEIDSINKIFINNDEDESYDDDENLNLEIEDKLSDFIEDNQCLYHINFGRISADLNFPYEDEDFEELKSYSESNINETW